MKIFYIYRAVTDKIQKKRKEKNHAHIISKHLTIDHL